MYLWPASCSMAAMPGSFGVMTTPGKWSMRPIQEGRWWACDNEAFTRRFDPDRFYAYLEKLQPYQDTCLFVSVPDVVGNALATLDKWRTHDWACRVRDMGFPVAFVAQDGQELFPLPPADQWDWLFIGGSTAWKMSEDADACILRAQAMGKRIHIGRVNSQRRMAHFEMIGADTCDGSGPGRAPDKYRRLFTNAFEQSVMPLFTVPGSNSNC